MPILQSIVHRIDKPAPDQAATLQSAREPMAESSAMADLLAGVNDSFHAKPKAWGHFADESRDDAFAAGLRRYVEGQSDFATFTREVAEKLRALVDDHLPLGGPVLFAHYQQGDTQYLSLALLHHRQGFGISESLEAVPTAQLNLGQLMLAARVDLGQWRGGKSRQYLAYIKDRGGKKLAEAFRELLGCEEGVDAGSETRTLLKAFSDYVEREEMDEQRSREKTDAVLDYASEQARRGDPITLDELSELVDEQHPKAFYDYIRHQDYGLSPEIPADKRALNQFRRFTGRAGGVSISFDSHLLGSSVEYDPERDRLIIKQVPPQLREQIKNKRGE